MTQESTPAEVYFDESGHDGENLIEGMTTVFAHCSIHMAKAEAEDLVEYIRSKTRTQAPELKASILSQGGESLIDHLYGPEGKLVGNVSVYLVEKENFAVGKIIDLLVEEAAYEQGINLYASGNARAMADDLYEYGPRALGKDGWNDLISGFTSLMRAKQRKGGTAECLVDSWG